MFVPVSQEGGENGDRVSVGAVPRDAGVTAEPHSLTTGEGACAGDGLFDAGVEVDAFGDVGQEFLVTESLPGGARRAFPRVEESAELVEQSPVDHLSEAGVDAVGDAG